MVENTPQGTPNPLQKYFRQPAIYVKLPSEGKGYHPGVLNMPANGEIPIYPMTAMDEIMARTPDALFNGSATADIFKSCVPNITNPWQILQSDVDLLLVAIRIATYGHEMEISTQCPKCKETNNFGLDLRVVLDGLKSPDYTTPVAIGGLSIYFKALTYQQLNESTTKQFQEQKGLAMANESKDLNDQEKLDLLKKSLQSISELTTQGLVQSISVIKTDDGALVDNQQHIQEFVLNANKQIFEAMRDKLLQVRESTALEPIKIECPECKNKYEQPFVLDQSNFFASDS